MSLQGVSETAAELHRGMLRHSMENEDSDIFSQQELLEMAGLETAKDLKPIIQELINNQLAQLATSTGDGQVMFKVVSLESASRKSRMSGDELMVYNCIEEAGREAIWTKIIKDRTKLHQTVIQRCLKSLEGRKEIKAIKSVKHPTRKVYMLFNLQPSVEVTGGPWFTDSEMDSEFINNLLTVVWRFVVSKSYPGLDEEGNQKPQESYPVSYNGYPTVRELLDFIVDNGIVNEGTDLGEADVRKLCEVLVYDDRLERREGGYSYKATWSSVLEYGLASQNARSFPHEDGMELLDPFAESACGQCPKFFLCDTKGPVNPVECVYYDEWLQ